MPSSNKTPGLQLNIWSGTDKPKRTDFNEDNQKIENAVMSHTGNTEVHVTPQDKINWDTQKVVTGYYTGNGASTRDIAMGFQPAAVFVMAVGIPAMETQADETVSIRSSVATRQQNGFGVTILETGFRVQSSTQQGAVAAKSELNKTSVSYFYIAYR